MKKIILLSVSALLFTACGDTTQPLSNTKQTSVTVSNTNSLVVPGHKTETQPTPPPTTGGSSTSPMQKPVDVAAQTAAIEKADKELKASPNDEAAKKALAKAYFDRAFVLTEAAQYRSALGDFRKGLKLDPTDEKAKGMHDQIIDIFKSIGREPPKEGEEPPPVTTEKPTA